jgi:hypothetical protein
VQIYTNFYSIGSESVINILTFLSLFVRNTFNSSFTVQSANTILTTNAKCAATDMHICLLVELQ